MKATELRCCKDGCFNRVELTLFPKDAPKKQERVCWQHAPSWAKQGGSHPTHTSRIIG